MKAIDTEVLVVGGGATGLGVARDAAMRGFATVLVERGDLAEGTTGRYHGLLHSGARYAVKDPRSARECIAENRVLRAIAADCIEDTGGLFVTTPWDDPAYGDKLLAGCSDCGIPVEEMSVAAVLQREPRLNPGILRAFVVPDAALDAWKLAWGCARSAEQHGAQILPYHRVTAVLRDGQVITGVAARDELTGEDVVVHAEFTVNATGAWAGKLADMAGCEGVDVVPGKGIMIAMNHRLVNTVINRCTMPSDGDILVPIRTVSVIGTTDSPVPDPDVLEVTQAEVDHMLDEGEKLVPGFRGARALRVWAGVRPLFQDKKQATADSRDISRSHALLDHLQRDGIERFATITGGKATTFRLMAEHTVDAVCAQLGARKPCRTGEEPLPGSEERTHYWLGSRLATSEEALHDDQLVCECELISRRTLDRALVRRPTKNLDDLRRALRLGMGPCQGGFCIYRAIGIVQEAQRVDALKTNAALRHFLQERWKGVAPILYGDQLRQARLDDWIFQGLLDVEHLPDAGAGAASTAPALVDAPRVSAPAPRNVSGPRSTRTSVVVVGAGLAGLVAAVRLAEGGHDVLLLAKGVGSTHLSGATVDVLGYSPDLVTHPLGSLPAFVDAHPDHPYAKVGPDAVQASAAWFSAGLGRARYVGDLSRNLLLATAAGAAKPSALVPRSMASGDVSGGLRVAVVGFSRLKDFFPSLVAANLSLLRLPGGGSVEARPVVLDLPPEGEADVRPLGFARLFDTPEFRSMVVGALAAMLEPGEAVAFPAVLGLTDEVAVTTQLADRLERPVFEIPTLPPSVPGIRLFRVAKEALAAAGGRLVMGSEVVAGEAEGRDLLAVRVRSAGRTRRQAGDQFVLAPGGWSAGQFELDSHWTVRETVLGLPLTGMPPVGEPRFLSGYLDHHPMARAGVAVDQFLRPLDGDGTVVYANVHVAGAALAGSEPWREKSGDGISLATGWHAAGAILEGAR